MEEWRDIMGYEGIYQISSIGHVRRIGIKSSSGHTLQARLLTIGKGKRYSTIMLYKDGISETHTIHRLVASAFLSGPSCCPTCNTKFDINHKDFNGHNNAASNLEYVTHSDNIIHSKGRQQQASAKILSDEKVIEMKYPPAKASGFPLVSNIRVSIGLFQS